jgi:hypothetical protein
MKSFSSKKINIEKILNIKNDSMTNIILKIKPENSRIYHFEKIEKDYYIKNMERLSPEVRNIKKNKFRKKILNEVNYVFNKSQNSINNEKIIKKNNITKNIYKNVFHTQINTSKIKQLKRENIINRKDIKIFLSDGIEKKKYLPKIKSSQFILLKGENNQTYPLKQIYKLKKENTLNKLDLTSFIPFLHKDDLNNKLNDYIIMEKLANKKKTIFKI